MTTTASTSSSSSSTVIYNFSNGVGQWQGYNVVGGPWVSNESTFASTDSLKADIQLYAGSIYNIYTDQVSTFTFAGYQRLVGLARFAPWGFQSGGTMSGKLYIKTNSSWTWYDSGAIQLNNNTLTQVVLNLNTIPSSSLADIREVGIEYTSSSDGSQTAVYFAYVTAEN
jgi:mannan endo-1,4-beta-mannosidase